jgi:type IV pilus assembly protein PilX
MHRNRANTGIGPQSQQGVALVVVLLLLLVITLLGLGSMRGALLQERMAANTLARGYAFQAAETALREAEQFARGKLTIPASGCSSGVCARTIDGAKPAWQEDGFWDAAGGYLETTTVDDQKMGVLPARYVVEDYGTASVAPTGGEPIDMGNPAPPGSDNMQLFRITVYSRTESGAEVMLQSLFKTPKNNP